MKRPVRLGDYAMPPGSVSASNAHADYLYMKMPLPFTPTHLPSKRPDAAELFPAPLPSKHRDAATLFPAPRRGREGWGWFSSFVVPHSGMGVSKGIRMFSQKPFPRKAWIRILPVLLAAGLFLILSFQGVMAASTYEEVRGSFCKSDTLILDRRGEVIHEVRTDPQVRRLEWTDLKDISPALKEAVVAAEDRRFYLHGGVDYRAMAVALIRALSFGGVRGASTISMQLASIVDSSLQSRKRRRSIEQKWNQIKTAVEIERSWTKEKILEAYLNIVGFRGEMEGISAASRGIFKKQPHGLDRSEALILASLIRSPGASREKLMKRASNLCKYLNWDVDEERLKDNVTGIFERTNFPRPMQNLAPHAARHILRGRKGEGSISTTIDSGVQRFSIERLKAHLSILKNQNVNEAAVLVADNPTGEILAYVSISEKSPYVDGIRARRQAGSSLKPFLYALAFDERLLTPASLLDDSKLDIGFPNGIYSPGNYDNLYRGKVTARTALASSLNIPAVRCLSLVGIDVFLAKLRCAGIERLNDSGEFYGPSLALGTADVSLFELVRSYMALANSGTRKELRFERGAPETGKRIFSDEAAFMVSDILSDREARSVTFGLENPLTTRFWSAVKTGTSKDMRDNWCVGYTNHYTVGVWFGNFSGMPMRDVSGVSGAAQVWTEIISRLHSGEMASPPAAPSGVVSEAVSIEGVKRREWFVKGTEPASDILVAARPMQRIKYPADGQIVTLDCDIPEAFQRIIFSARVSDADNQWLLNGRPMGSAAERCAWKPQRGKYRLTLADRSGGTLDSVNFEVRGPDG